MQGDNIQHFDYGPYPFGGWRYQELRPGTVMTKKFAKVNTSQFVQFGIMLGSNQAVTVDLLVNGVPHRFSFPDMLPNKSDRRMVSVAAPVTNGVLEIRVLSVSGGPVYAIYDCQREYSRSALDEKLLPGEWVIRAVTPR